MFFCPREKVSLARGFFFWSWQTSSKSSMYLLVLWMMEPPLSYFLPPSSTALSLPPTGALSNTVTSTSSRARERRKAAELPPTPSNNQPVKQVETANYQPAPTIATLGLAVAASWEDKQHDTNSEIAPLIMSV